MSYRIVAALALSLGLSTAALAQTSGTETTTGSANGEVMLPTGWEGEIADAFFSDPDAGTLKPEAEITANWGNLSAEQQASVRSECETRTAATGTDTTTGTGTTAGATTDTTTGGASTDTTAGAETETDDEMQTGATGTTGTDTTTGGAAAGATTADPTLEASLTQLCGMIEGM